MISLLVQTLVIFLALVSTTIYSAPTDLPDPTNIHRPLPFEFIVKNLPFLQSSNYHDEEILRRTNPIELVIHIPQPAPGPFVTTDVNNPTAPFIPATMTIEIVNADYVEGLVREPGDWFWNTQVDRSGKHNDFRDPDPSPPEWDNWDSGGDNEYHVLSTPTGITTGKFGFERVNKENKKQPSKPTLNVLDYPFAPERMTSAGMGVSQDDTELITLPETDYETIESRFWIGTNIPELPQIDHSFQFNRTSMILDVTFENIGTNVFDIIEMSLPALGLVEASGYGCKFDPGNTRNCPSISLRLILTDTTGKTISTSTQVPMISTNLYNFVPISSLGANYKPFNFTFIPYNIMNYNSLRPFESNVASLGVVLGIIFGVVFGCIFVTVATVVGIFFCTGLLKCSCCCCECCEESYSYSSTYTPTVITTTTTTTATPAQATTAAQQEEEWPLEAEVGVNTGPNKANVEMTPVSLPNADI